MNPKSTTTEPRACWFVGATYDGRDDQTSRFVDEGIWENGYNNRYLDVVKAILPGDRIAIKSTYIRKNNLPFDNRGHIVSVMAIKAIGVVKKNLGDGRKLEVDWKRFDKPREWYFFTYRGTVFSVRPGDWMRSELIAFTFEHKEQNIDRFRNEPYWKERFGDGPIDNRFLWTKFYQAIADKLLECKNDRSRLITGLREMAERVDKIPKWTDNFKDGTKGPMRDICPFTFLGIFNRGIKGRHRQAIAAEFAKFLGVAEPVPTSFDGIPILNNQSSWFFGYETKRRDDDIDALWTIFAEAIRFADSDDANARSGFATAFDDVIQRYGVGWNLTIGLYWIRPWEFPTLDSKSRHYIADKMGFDIDTRSSKGRCTADDYISLLEKLEARFLEQDAPERSFPELSLAAWQIKGDQDGVIEVDEGEEAQEPGDTTTSEPSTGTPVKPYSIDDIMSDGCFIARAKLDMMLVRLRTKKNLILQGPPGTGKSWLAKRLGFALMQEQDSKRLRAVQFHPNLSYEDFVRGHRPGSNGTLDLVDGPLLDMVAAARSAPDATHVFVIEEINRGNPAQIFGEMLTLLEADKRNENEALELCHRRHNGERVHIPANLFVIGTMNIADRSIAPLDMALRRRFAFIDLEPTFGDRWRTWVCQSSQVSVDILGDIEKRLGALNDEIAEDKRLGRQFRIGHSFVTPHHSIGDAQDWFRQVVETEIGPLLEEYWFDDLERARKAKTTLLEGF